MGRVLDIAGQRFAYLQAIRCIGKVKQGNSVWLFKCWGFPQHGCKGTHEAVASTVKRGGTTSCGCVKRKIAAERMVDITGQRFACLEAVRPLRQGKGGRYVWLFKCHGDARYGCNGTHEADASAVKFGGIKSCGCANSKSASERRRLDIAGQRFAYLEAVKPTGKIRGSVVWLFKCHGFAEFGCKGTHTAPVGAVKIGNTTSCGCASRKATSESARARARRYEVCGELYTAKELAEIVGVSADMVSADRRNGLTAEQIIKKKRLRK